MVYPDFLFQKEKLHNKKESGVQCSSGQNQNRSTGYLLLCSADVNEDKILHKAAYWKNPNLLIVF